jgi:hypothetical protein
MQTKSFLRQTGICGALALILTVSQADAFSRRWPDVHSAPAEQALITQPMFNGPPEVRIVYAMAYEYGEYVRFRQGNMIAEIAYDTSKDGGDEISLRYEERMKEMIEGWHFNARRGISYDGGGVLANGYDQIEYRTYRLNDGHACVAISYASDASKKAATACPMAAAASIKRRWPTRRAPTATATSSSPSITASPSGQATATTAATRSYSTRVESHRPSPLPKGLVRRAFPFTLSVACNRPG